MQKQFIPRTPLLVLAICLPALLPAHGRIEFTPAESSSISAPNTNPIISFEITAYTASSITLTWTSSVPNLYFMLEGFNNSSTTPLAPVYTQAYTHTYTGLPAGNNFTFKLYYREDPTAPFEYAARTTGNTGIIVVDEIVEFQNADPENSGEPPFIIPLLPSQAAFPEIDNHYLAEFTYENATFRFACGLHNDTVYVQELVDKENAYQLVQITTTETRCMYDGQTTVFKLTSPVFNGWYSVQATFLQPVSDYKFTPAGEVALQAPPRNPKRIDAADRSAASQLERFVPPYPNPFDAETVVPYVLNSDGQVLITLTDVVGRTVQIVEKIALQKAGLHQARIDGAGIPDGIYYLHVQAGAEYRVHTLVKRE